MYCPKCGAEVSEEDNYCYKCGSQLKKATTSELSRKLGINIIAKDSLLQEYWIKRCVAYIIDSIIVSGITFILAFILFFPQIILQGKLPSIDLLFPVGLISLVYFIFLEYFYGYTFGKKVMGFKIESEDSKTVLNVFIRNLSKIFWVLLFLDVVGGLITPGDPIQKYSDRLVKMHVKGEYSPPQQLGVKEDVK
ncbi:MAG: RDD family protein [Nitrososphaeria archaeon]|nr:RDD family protein [Nitrososphaeria archaeon]